MSSVFLFALLPRKRFWSHFPPSLNNFYRLSHDPMLLYYPRQRLRLRRTATVERHSTLTTGVLFHLPRELVRRSALTWLPLHPRDFSYLLATGCLLMTFSSRTTITRKFNNNIGRGQWLKRKSKETDKNERTATHPPLKITRPWQGETEPERTTGLPATETTDSYLPLRQGKVPCSPFTWLTAKNFFQTQTLDLKSYEKDHYYT